FTLLFLLPLSAQEKTKPNILFIAVDDLKPILGCYGNTLIKTPNIDRLAKMGTVFMSNYCQQAVCGPTRASIMTGKRPDYTKVWDLKTKMRDINPDILSLPQYLMSQGYSTQGIGKIYDSRCVDKKMDAPSWSVPYYNYFKTEERYYAKETGMPILGAYQLPETKELAAKYTKEGQDKGLADKELDDYVSKLVKPSVESADVPDKHAAAMAIVKQITAKIAFDKTQVQIDSTINQQKILEKELSGRCVFAKLNVDEARELSIQYGVTSVPTFVFIKNNEIKHKETGYMGKEDLRAKIEDFIGR
ncbi:MAG: hypothetical protein EBT45_07520, partial [Alphaproteobacteria bacterium]|nr:hypothetical protein [Alphaproteobacteria bacterium]